MTEHTSAARSGWDAIARAKVGAAVAGALVLGLVAGFIGYTIGDPPTRAVTVSRTFSGTISVLNGRHTAGCVKPEGGGAPVCSRLAATDVGPLRIGQHVHAALEWADEGNDTKADLLLVYG